MARGRMSRTWKGRGMMNVGDRGPLFDGDGAGSVEGFDGDVVDAADLAREAIRRGAYARASCLSCGAAIGVVVGVGGGAQGGLAAAAAGAAAYCGDCWRMHMEDARDEGGCDAGGGGGGADAAHAKGERGFEFKIGGMTVQGRMQVNVGREGDEHGGVPLPQGDEGLAGRLRKIIRSLEEAYEGVGEVAPLRAHVVAGMLADGGAGAWKTAEDAERCLDGPLNGIVYEPSAGRLALIDGE